MRTMTPLGVNAPGGKSREEVPDSAQLEAARLAFAKARRPWENPDETRTRFVEDELRRKLESKVPGLVGWLGGGAPAGGVVSGISPWCMSHPERRKMWQPLLTASDDDDRARAAHVALDTGLRQRLAVREDGKLYGGFPLTDAERLTVGHLCAMGAAVEDGIAICADCDLVFPTSRKRSARKCDRCHSWARPATEYAPYRTTVARQVCDENGEPVGWKSHTVAYCEGCGARMEACRRDTRTCTSRCRERVRHGVLVRPGVPPQ